MGVDEEGWGGWPPAPGGAPLYIQKDDHWTHFDNSVNAVSFGFVATAILISMFLVMAIFEKLLRTTSPAISPADGRRRHSDIEAQNHIDGFNAKLGYPSPKIGYSKEKAVSKWICLIGSIPKEIYNILFLSNSQMFPNLNKLMKISANAREVSVVMPGNNIPTFIANPAPVPLPPERTSWPSHQQQSNIHAPPSSS